MRSRSVLVPFVLSLVTVPIMFAVSTLIGGPQEADKVTLALFGATILVEVLALMKVLQARKMFSSSDSGYLTWTLIALFLAIRLVGETRLATINFRLVPRYSEGAGSGLFVYIIIFRYLYTLSDLLFIAALTTTIRAYKSTGLKFEVLKRDYLYMLLVWAMPVVTFIFRENLIYSNTAGSDKYIAAFRMITVTVGALIASWCLVVRRYAMQMGGGAVARVWNMVAIAGIARDASFFVLALMSSWWRPGAGFVEQYLLWVFACCWLMAALYQQEVLPRASEPRLVPAPAG